MKRTYIRTAAVTAAVVLLASVQSPALPADCAVIPGVSGINPYRLDVPSVRLTEGEYGTGLNAAGIYPALYRGTAGDEVSLPESYSLRDEGVMSPVRDQSGFGTCWAHSAVACVEAQIYSRGNAVDLSEFQLAGKIYREIDRDTDLSELIDRGATADAAIALWAQWNGTCPEYDMPYGDVDRMREKLWDDYSIYHLENAYTFDYDHDRTNEKEINALVKQMILSGKPVDVSFQSSASKYYDRSNYSTYSPKRPRFANHSVAIAGWDDSYPKENFKIQPEHDGAWLCKNSWGAAYGDEGYIWLSYDDGTISEFTTFELGRADNFTTIFQHDTFPPTQSLSSSDDDDYTGSSFMANIFTEENGGENISACATWIRQADTEYKVWIYTDLSDPNDPTSGTPHEVSSGSCALPGYQTIRFDIPVYAEQGSRFSVVAELKSSESPFVIPIECTIAVIDSSTGEIECLDTYTDYESLTASTGAGESFHSADGKEWYDLKGDDYHYDEAGEQELLDAIYEQLMDGVEPEDTDILKSVDIAMDHYRTLFEAGEVSAVMGNIALKAFGDPADKVNFSCLDGMMQPGELLELTAVSGKPIHYAINGDMSDIKTYTAPITIASPVTIKAWTDENVITEGSFMPQEAGIQMLEYSFGDGSVKQKAIIEAPFVTPQVITIPCDPEEETVRLRIFAEGAVTVNGKAAENGVYTDAIDISGSRKEIDMVISEEGLRERHITIKMDGSPDMKKGDVNLDGLVDSSDASAVLEHYSSLSTGESGTIPDELLSSADFDGSGVVDSSDASEILRYYAENATE